MSPRRLYFGDLILELDRMRLIGPNGPVDLRPKTFDVLRYIVDHAGRVVRKSEIISAVWSDVVVTDESLTRCISEIRRALGSENQSLVRTVQRRGYVFEGHVTASEEAERHAEPRPSRPAWAGISPPSEVCGNALARRRSRSRSSM